MTLTCELDLSLDSVKRNLPAKYQGQTSFSSEVIVRAVRHTHARTGSTALLEPLKWPATNQLTRQGVVCVAQLADSELEVGDCHDEVRLRTNDVTGRNVIVVVVIVRITDGCVTCRQLLHPAPHQLQGSPVAKDLTCSLTMPATKVGGRVKRKLKSQGRT